MKAQTKLKLAKDKSLVLNITCYSDGYLHISLVCYSMNTSYAHKEQFFF